SDVRKRLYDFARRSAPLDLLQVDMYRFHLAKQNHVMTFAFVGVSPDRSIWKDSEKCCHRALHRFQIRFEELHVYGNDTTGVGPPPCALENLFGERFCSAFRPGLKGMEGYPINFFLRRKNKRPPVIVVHEFLRTATYIEFFFDKIFPRHFRYE